MSKARRKAKGDIGQPKFWLLLVVLLALGTIAYSNSFGAPLVFDDLVSIQKNSSVRLGEFNWNPLSGRALLYVTFTLNYIWTGQDVWSYHLVNLLMHLANGVLLFLLAERVFRKTGFDLKRGRLYALAAALFFLVHPVQTESVTYISSRSELLSTLFYLAAFLLFVCRSEARTGIPLSLAIAPLFLLGMSAKETAISLPVTLLLYDFLVLSKSEWRSLFSRWRFYLTFLVGGVYVAYYVATVTLRGSIGPGPKNHLSVWLYFLTQLRVLVRYVFVTFFPVGLNLDYEFPPSGGFLEFKVIGSLIFLSALVLLGWRIRRSHPIFSSSIFWFFLTLAPTSSVVPILDVIFEHRLYLPLVGVSLSFPLFVEWAGRRLRDWVPACPGPAALTAIILVVLTVGTLRRNHVWGDEVRLFEDVVSKSPGKARAYSALAWAHYKRAEYAEAITVLDRAVKNLPDQQREFVEFLGQLYLKTGRLDDALTLYREALPSYTQPELIAIAQNNIGVIYLGKWNHLKERMASLAPSDYQAQMRAILTPASEAFAAAVAADPQMFSAWDSFIFVSGHLGTVDALEAKTLAALEVKETFNDLYAVGKIAFEKRDYARAAEFFERAEKLVSTEKLLYFNHGYALESIRKPNEAIEKYVQALRLDPIFLEAHHNLAVIYMQQGRNGEALEHFLEVIRYNPNHDTANKNLAKLYAALGDRESARRRLETLLRLRPGDPIVLGLWQDLGL